MAETTQHKITVAKSGRSRCRGCGQAIARGTLRFGEKVENPYNDGLSTLWFHLRCAAYKRPEPLLETLDAIHEDAGGDRVDAAAAREALEAGQGDVLRAAAQEGLQHQRLPRIDAIERASSGRASCRHCRQRIAKDALRIKLVWFEGGRFDPGGYLHLACAPAYCESTALGERLRCFTAGADDAIWSEVEAALRPAEP